MSNKYEILNPVGMYLGNITKYRAEKAIFHGMAVRGKSIDRNSILVNCHSMMEFEQQYKEFQKHNKKLIAKCWDCGESVKMDSKSKRPYCTKCSELRKNIQEEESELFSKLRARSMLERAFKIIEQQHKFIKIEKYKEVASVMEDYIEENYTKFDSSHEMVAAMELIMNRVQIKIQPLVGNRKPDIMLVEEKVILEIDGFLHKHTQEADSDIRRELGIDWEVIRIPTKHIETNITMLYEAIMELKIYKQKLRNDNNGMIPDYYSEREEVALSNMLKK